ncbi:MAG TPA: twin-arginine translocase subunit TatC [Bacteroidales bacterium]|nr:twin-arginine translocase subunit TatC [Bacteroidales bacterium]HHU99854.1 twin-arginine translocase subunit TatC [Bacteroidales bacterium]
MAGKSKAKNSNPDGEMTFLQHLEELRWHIIRSLVAIVIGAIVAFMFKDIIFDHIILAPNNPDFITNRLLCRLADMVNVPLLCINQNPVELISIKLTGQFTTHITISLVAGLILAFPYVFREFWSFFRPALYEKERKYARGAVTMASLLFLAGIIFGYFIIAPLSINFLGTYRVSDLVTNQINITSYIGSVTSVALASGITFELPIVVFFLARIGVLTPEFMRKYRRHAIVVVLVVAAVITPPDVFSLILVSIPLLILYEVSIFLAARVVRQREAAEAKEAAEEAKAEAARRKKAAEEAQAEAARRKKAAEEAADAKDAEAAADKQKAAEAAEKEKEAETKATAEAVAEKNRTNPENPDSQGNNDSRPGEPDETAGN